MQISLSLVYLFIKIIVWQRMRNFCGLLAFQILFLTVSSQLTCSSSPCSYNYTYSLSKNNALPNPFKGYVSFSTASTSSMAGFPLSLENAYFSMKVLMTGSNTFDLSSFETMLTQTKSRGHQAIVRIHADYPGTPGASSIPSYLTGVTMCTYTSYGGGLSPNYDDPNLIAAMVALINKLGSVYDGDNRIAVIQTGFIGHWGEYHVASPCSFASSSTITTILQTFKSAFLITKILLRDPEIKGTISTASLGMGYHDDSFNADSIITPFHSNSFQQKLINAGAANQWQQYPIGGETRPQINTCIFGALILISCASHVLNSLIPQDLTICINTLHVSWIWNSGVFQKTAAIISAGDYQRALNSAGNMGYSFQVSQSSLAYYQSNGSWLLNVSATIINQGVAPFYYRLSCNVNINGVDTALTASASLANLLPGSSAIVSASNIAVSSSLTAVYLQLVSPDTYVPIRFAVAQVASNGVLYIDGTAPNHSQTSYLAIIIGVSVGGVVLIAGIVALLCWYKNRQGAVAQTQPAQKHQQSKDQPIQQIVIFR